MTVYDEGYLYCIGSTECLGSRVKIGISADPEQRLKTFQMGSPCVLGIKWMIKVEDMNSAEKQAHGALSLWRLHGEWFEIPAVEIGELSIAIGDGIKSGDLEKAIRDAMSLDPAVRWPRQAEIPARLDQLALAENKTGT